MSQQHVIDELIFDISFEKVDANLVQDDYLQALLVEALLPMADLELSRYSNPAAHIKFDLLEIDLGDIPSDAVKEEISRRFPAALRDALERMQLSTTHTTSLNLTKNALSLSDINYLKIFLFTGRMPWHTALNDHVAHQVLLNRLVVEDSDELLLLIRRVIKNLASARRLIHQFSSPQLLSLFKKHSPVQIDMLNGLIEDMQSLFRETAGNYVSDATIREAIWLPLLAQIVQFSGQSFDKSMLLIILNGIVNHLAQKMGRSYQDLLIQMQKNEFSTLKQSASLLPELIFDLNKKIENVFFLAAKDTYVDQQEFVRLEKFLIGNTASNLNDVSERINLEVLFNRLLASNADQLFRILIQGLKNPESRRRLIYCFPEQQLISLLRKVLPAKSNFLENFIEQLQSILIKIESLGTDATTLHEIIWEHVLADVVASLSLNQHEIQLIPILNKIVIFFAKKIGCTEYLLLIQIQNEIFSSSKASKGLVAGLLMELLSKKSQPELMSNSIDIHNPSDLDQLRNILIEDKNIDQFDSKDWRAVDTLLGRLLIDYPDHLFRFLANVIKNPVDTQRFIQSTSRHQRVAIIKQILPAQFDMLDELIKQLESLCNEKNALELSIDYVYEIIWHQVLASVLAPASFHEKEANLYIILDEVIDKLAQYSGRTYRYVLDRMLSKIESDRKGSFQLLSDSLQMLTQDSGSSTQMLLSDIQTLPASSVANEKSHIADRRIVDQIPPDLYQLRHILFDDKNADQFDSNNLIAVGILVDRLLVDYPDHLFRLLANVITNSVDTHRFIQNTSRNQRIAIIKKILPAQVNILNELIEQLESLFTEEKSLELRFAHTLEIIWHQVLVSVLAPESFRDKGVNLCEILNKVIGKMAQNSGHTSRDVLSQMLTKIESDQTESFQLLSDSLRTLTLDSVPSTHISLDDIQTGSASSVEDKKSYVSNRGITDQVRQRLVTALMSKDLQHFTILWATYSKDYQQIFIDVVRHYGRYSSIRENLVLQLSQPILTELLQILDVDFFTIISIPIKFPENFQTLKDLEEQFAWEQWKQHLLSSAMSVLLEAESAKFDLIMKTTNLLNKIVEYDQIKLQTLLHTWIDTLPNDEVYDASAKILESIESARHDLKFLYAKRESQRILEAYDAIDYLRQHLFLSEDTLHLHTSVQKEMSPMTQDIWSDIVNFLMSEYRDEFISFLRGFSRSNVRLMSQNLNQRILENLKKIVISYRLEQNEIDAFSSIYQVDSIKSDALATDDVVLRVPVSDTQMSIPKLVGISSQPIDPKQSTDEAINLLLSQLSSGKHAISALPLNEAELYCLISMYLKSMSMIASDERLILLDAIDTLSGKTLHKIVYLRKILTYLVSGKVPDLIMLERIYNDIQIDSRDLPRLQKSLREGKLYLYSLDLNEAQLNQLIELSLLQGQITLDENHKNFLVTIEEFSEESKNKKMFLHQVLQTLLDNRNLDLDAILEDGNLHLESDLQSSSVLASTQKPEVEQSESLYILIIHFLHYKKSHFPDDRNRFIDAIEQMLLRDPVGLHKLFKEDQIRLRANHTYLRLIDALPERLLTRILLLLRPEDHADIQRSADVVGDICISELTYLNPTLVVQHKWIYLFENLLMQSSIYVKNTFVEGLTDYLLIKAGVASQELHERLKSLARQKLLLPLVIPREKNPSQPPVIEKLSESNSAASSVRTQSIAKQMTADVFNEILLDTYSDDADFTEEIYLANAGLVLAAPYLPRLFSTLSLIEDGCFIDVDAAERAVHLLEFMVNCRTVSPEYQLTLNKLICGIKTQAPIISAIDITDKEKDVIEGLLRSIIHHWKTIGNTTITGLREAFFQRKGILQLREDAWHLQVQPGTFDMLLDRLPWSISIIKYPWMERPIHVKWR